MEIEAGGGEYYEWLSLTPDDTLSTVYVSTLADTYYPVKIIYETFCKWFDTVYVNIDNSCNSNNVAFSPNNDGINDYLHIDGADGFDNTVTIYDRWGSEVNFFTNYNNNDIAWQGDDAGGSPLAHGTYFYIIENGGVMINGAHIEKVGWVQLVK